MHDNCSSGEECEWHIDRKGVLVLHNGSLQQEALPASWCNNSDTDFSAFKFDCNGWPQDDSEFCHIVSLQSFHVFWRLDRGMGSSCLWCLLDVTRFCSYIHIYMYIYICVLTWILEVHTNIITYIIYVCDHQKANMEYKTCTWGRQCVDNVSYMYIYIYIYIHTRVWRLSFACKCDLTHSKTVWLAEELYKWCY